MCQFHKVLIRQEPPSPARPARSTQTEPRNRRHRLNQQRCEVHHTPHSPQIGDPRVGLQWICGGANGAADDSLAAGERGSIPQAQSTAAGRRFRIQIQI